MLRRSKVFAIAGFIFSGLALVFLIASFASPYWVESQRNVQPSGFLRMGLWEACFRNYYDTYQITNKRYDGCFTVVSYEFRELRGRFIPTWFQAVEGMVTFSLILQVGIVVINIIYFIHCFQIQTELYCIFAAAVANFICAFFLGVSTIMFGVRVGTDRQWLPEPDLNYLSWAYGFCILSAFLSLFGAMSMLTDFFRLRSQAAYDSRGQSYAMSPNSYRY